MQRHKSTEKRARQSKKANVANRMARSRVKTAVNKVLEAKDKSQYHFKHLASAVKSHEEDNALLSKEVQKVQDKTNVLKREAEMSTAPTTNFGSYLPWILDGVIALLGLVIVYMIYRRFTYVPPTVMEQVEQVLGGRNKSR